jgi:hypothetical protein
VKSKTKKKPNTKRRLVGDLNPVSLVKRRSVNGPPREHPKVIWVTMRPSGKLEAWWGNPDDGSRPNDVPPEARRYEQAPSLVLINGEVYTKREKRFTMSEEHKEKMRLGREAKMREKKKGGG